MKNREFRALMAAVLLMSLVAGSLGGPSFVYAKDAKPSASSVVSISEKQSPVIPDTSGSPAGTDTKASKIETVYAKIDGDGTVSSVTVSDQLKNITDISQVEDSSTLMDIINVKGDETFSQAKDSLVWNNGKKEICYQGNTSKELPVGIHISYTLDGKSVSAKDLEGKSGHLILRYTYDNLTGSDSSSYTPFLMVTGLVLDSGHFSNAAVKNGKLISDGDRNMVLGMGIPKMKEELGINDLDIPDYFELEADVSNYKAIQGITVAANDVFNNLDTDKFDSITELQDSMGKLQDSSNQLVSGSGELRSGLDTLLSSSGALTDGIARLADGGSSLAQGSQALAGGTNQLKEGTSTLKDGAQKLAQGADTVSRKTSGELKNGAAALQNGLSQLKEGAGTLSGAVGQLHSGFYSDGGLINGAARVSAGAQDVKSGADGVCQLAQAINGMINTGDAYIDISAGEASLNEAVAALQALEGMEGITPEIAAQIDAAISQIYAAQGEHSEALSAAQAKLDESSSNASSINELTAQLAAGTEALSAGASGLSDGASALERGIGATAAGVSQLNASVNDPEQGLVASTNALSAGSAQLSNGVDQLSSGLSELSAGANEVKSGSSLLDNKMEEANSGASTLAFGAAQISDGTSQLSSGSDALIDGVKKLSSGSGTLNDGMIQFNEEGIKKLVSAFDGDIDGMLAKLNAMLDASKSYKNFSGISKDMDGEVRFVFVNK